ncbi:Na antiporter NhaA protein [Marine Group I thaumarchaeote SCGC RSA3]|uniref:Na antiporter NhaA protein n=3 Tax=Marine Group I TaxID=905826 RepID=A0A087RVH1_9ARCH|nr:putative disulfide bond formation protein D [Marine Group I thaumarchaeote SCGC AAA799-N04]KFM15909.1 putative disulfide bond formation protein D [Marine Group I thaumarchaeote SCGC AAA799-D11]KFM17475.1 Na antiporter NhaA protein [Marine Group I thaumarchaeote SCGC RSA3]
MKIQYFSLIVIAAGVITVGAIFSTTSNDSESINLDMNRKIGTVDTSLGSPILGSPNAPITIIEFGDYQCSNCKKWFLDTKPDIMTNYIDTGKVSLVFVDIAFLGKDSGPASIATYCAEEQGKYWKYHGFLYSNQMSIDNGWANSDSLKGYANNLGLNMELFVSCLDSEKYSKRVQFNTDESKRNGVTGTPTFFIIGPNGEQEKIAGPQPYTVFEKIFESMA